MKINETIGIDVSKLTIDAHIFKVDSGFTELLEWVNENSMFPLSEQLFAFEHTGLYSFPLSIYLTNKRIAYLLIPGLELKKSLGIARGKDDKIDAKAIAVYAYRRREEVTPYQLPSRHLLELRRLLSLRDKLVKQRAGFKATNKEIKGHLSKTDSATYFAVHENMIKHLSKEIGAVEKQLRLIIQTDVNQLANKKFKSLLSNCATTALNHNTEMRMYYERRLKEGKDKMSTINILRNKILGRIFAVVQRGTPYVDTFAYAA
jgi:transposase